MFHHLPGDEKQATLREIRRVLKAGGRFCLVDFEIEEAATHNWFSRLFHSHARMKDNTRGRILELMMQAGFANPRIVGERQVIFGLARAGYYLAPAA
jgi:ubiquinone/menaquinone biosynthesis C-methylase UbiE